MKNDIIFIGGIHGVGKGTLCERIESELGIVHLSASEVLKWKDLNVDSSDKRVADIDSTQDRLLNNLKGIIIPGQTYLLDGHFCGSSEIWSDKLCIKKKKTAGHIVYLNNDKQIYPYEQQFSISCMGSIFPQMFQRGIQR